MWWPFDPWLHSNIVAGIMQNLPILSESLDLGVLGVLYVLFISMFFLCKYVDLMPDCHMCSSGGRQ